MADDERPESVLGDEATRLFATVQEWARQTFPAGRDGHQGPECQWCPLCQFMAVLRGDRPEVSERVAEAGSAILSAVRSVVDAASSGAAETTGTQSPPRPPRVQHIDLGRSDE